MELNDNVAEIFYSQLPNVSSQPKKTTVLSRLPQTRMIALIVVGLLVGHTHGSVSTNKYSPLGPASSMEKDSKVL